MHIAGLKLSNGRRCVRDEMVHQSVACGIESRGCLSDALLEIDHTAFEPFRSRYAWRGNVVQLGAPLANAWKTDGVKLRDRSPERVPNGKPVHIQRGMQHLSR